ncbi:MAG: ATP-binding cassette domain-containing protein, partial [Cyanobacteriota bacterium]|nr:ATP-binding cassette domain-containing protein [Cyanobacteriota bacterium]
MSQPLLETRNLGVRFGGLQALEAVDLEVRQGEIFGLLGPNGAGKTTLFNLISGVTAASAGEVLWRGGRIDGLDPNRIARLGIARTFQNLRLFSSLNCRDNVLVGLHRQALLPWAAALLGTALARRRQ